MNSLLKVLVAIWAAAVLAACGGGGGASSEPPAQPAEAQAVIRATALAVSSSSNTVLQTAVGSTLTLDASGSSATGGVSAYQWSVTSSPAGSTATVTNAGSALASFAPDLPGAYSLSLRVTSTGGAAATAVLAVNVAAAPPAVTIVSNVSFSGPSTTRPTQSLVIGSSVVLDATGSTDPSGGTVGVTWQLLAAPAGSTASIAGSGLTTQLTPDVAGRYQVRARGTNPSGVYADVLFNFDALSTAPLIVVSTSVTTVGTSSTLNAAVGYLVSLDGAASLTPGAGTSGTWSLQGKPAGSNVAQLTGTSATAVSFVPDVPGLYTVQYTLLDASSGASSFHRTLVNVVLGPTAVVTGSVSPVANVNGPSFVGAVGSQVRLRGSASYDPGGDTLLFTWDLLTRPTGSQASFVSASSADTSITPDVNGRYDVTLTVRNSAGLVATQLITVYVGSYPPVAAVDRSQLLTLLGGTVTASAAASTAPSGNALAFSWAIDSRPTGSSATIASPNQAVLSFTPDVAGTYYATVTVSDGPVNSIAGVTIVALSASAGTVPLAYKPLLMRYSKSQGKAVIVSTNPNALHLVDPASATDVSVGLPASAKALNISDDGTLAAVLHEGSVSLVDLVAGSLLRTSATGGSQSDAPVTNTGLVVLVGQTNGQWVSPGITLINGRTGATVTTGGAFGSIYGTTRALLGEAVGKLFTQSEGLSPQDIYATTIDRVTGALGSTADSPYHGDFTMGNPLWLSADQSLLFTASGNYFRTSDLRYGGTLGSAVFSLSHSASADELVALQNGSTGFYYQQQPTQYPAVYKRYTGSLLSAANDVALPLVGGAQSYGLAIFHAADDRKVMVVQTGSEQPQASGLAYYLLLR
jgi:PKD domain